MISRSLFAPVMFALTLCALNMASPAKAQSIQAGGTTASVLATYTDSGSILRQEWASVATNPKTTQLLAFGQGTLGCMLPPNPTAGISTGTTVRYSQGGASTDLTEQTTIIPLSGNSTRYPGASACLVIGRYQTAPGLVVPRLLIRYKPSDWSVVEYSFRRDGRVSEMSIRHGDCIFGSSLSIVGQRNSQANASLRGVLNASAHPGHSLAEGLLWVYDVRRSPVGQNELLLSTALMTSANIEEEYDFGYISGTLEQSFKPDHRDSFLIQQSKLLAKSAVQQLLKYAASQTWTALASIFGF